MLSRALIRFALLPVSCIGILAACAQETVLDVDMPTPYVALPLAISTGQPAGFTVEASEYIHQESGPEAELIAAYYNFPAAKVWPVWAKLPVVTGEYVFVMGDEKAHVSVSEDKALPYAQRIAVEHVKGSGKPEASSPVVIQRAVQLPLMGKIKQVSGPETELLPDKSASGKAWAKIPDQVCTLIFASEGTPDRAVVRVWADRNSRCFVSGKTGDDANSGMEDKPFKTLQRAVKQLHGTPQKKGAIYLAGGEYDLGADPLVLGNQISVFGGFDENGWRRDPVITAPVLLPHGFRENWIDDISDRHKDLRRAQPRYHETVIVRHADKPMTTLQVSAGSDPGLLAFAGTPDTYIDGLTVYGTDEHTAGDEDTSIGFSPSNKRTLRNCIVVHFYGGGHDFIMSTDGHGHVENNIIERIVDPYEMNDRPQMAGSFGRWSRNLIIGGSGGTYSRIINIWGESGTFIENQVHGGECLEWTGMQSHHGSMHAHRIDVFRKNLMYLDYLFFPFMGTGVVMEDNEIHLFKGGVVAGLWASKALTIAHNDFRLAPGLDKEKFWPDARTHKLGGKFEKERYIEPEGSGTGTPALEPNTFTVMDKPDRRMGNLIDLKKLVAQAKKVGHKAYVMPRDPAKNLSGKATGKGTVALSWDESADPDVVGYIVRYGQKSNSYLNPTILGKVKSAEIKNLQPGTWYFTVVPIKEGNLECWKLSNEAEVVVQ